MGEGLPGAVSEFIEFQGTLYAAGRIDDDESDETAFGMARWTGSGWDRLALLGRPGSKYPNIRAMEVFEGELVVGGDFDFVDGQPANNLAVYDGTAFRPFHDDPTGPYPNGTVYDLKAHGGDLYLAGAFTRVGDIASRGIARWQALRPATGLLAGSPAVSRTSDGAEIRWQADPATVGFFSFDVYREDPGTGRVKLTDIPLSGRIDYLVSDPGFTLDATTYWVAELSHDGGVTWHGPLTLPIPALVLRQNRPNPAAASTTIEFESPVDGPVRVRVFDLNGRLVATPFARAVSTGPQQFTWDPRDSHGRPLAAGVYFYRLETPAGERTRKMILVSR
jgi:hypothetical protein